MVGLELGPTTVRAVVLDAWRSTPRKTLVAEWDPARPEDAAARLLQQLGPTRRIALSVGLGFLHVKRVKLPPAPAAERRRILALEPDRFFPVQGEALVISLADQASLAFAADADQLGRWIDAFGVWAPVENVEASPLSLLRAVGRSTQGTFGVPAGAQELGIVEIQDGQVRSARRVPAELAASVVAEPLPALGRLPGEFSIALGAARGIGGSADAMLLPDGNRERLERRRLRRLSVTAVVCAALCVLALGSLDRSRERTLQRILSEAASVGPGALPAVRLRDRLAAMDRESAAITEIAGRRLDPLRVLAVLSERLPDDATVLSLRASAADWQIDGTALDAAAIVPLLDRDDRFEDVRFLSASSRFRDGDRTYETFSIAFRVRPST